MFCQLSTKFATRCKRKTQDLETAGNIRAVTVTRKTGESLRVLSELSHFTRAVISNLTDFPVHQISHPDTNKCWDALVLAPAGSLSLRGGPRLSPGEEC